MLGLFVLLFCCRVALLAECVLFCLFLLFGRVLLRVVCLLVLFVRLLFSFVLSMLCDCLFCF